MELRCVFRSTCFYCKIGATPPFLSLYISETNEGTSLKFCTLFIGHNDKISRKYEANLRWSVARPLVISHGLTRYLKWGYIADNSLSDIITTQKKYASTIFSLEIFFTPTRQWLGHGNMSTSAENRPYADDISLYSVSVTGLQRSTDICVQYDNRWRFRFNRKKSKCMVVGKCPFSFFTEPHWIWRLNSCVMKIG